MVADSCGFELVGKVYSNKLAFKCLARGHIRKIKDCGKRLPQAKISCTECRKEEKEAIKHQQEEEEIKM